MDGYHRPKDQTCNNQTLGGILRNHAAPVTWLFISTCSNQQYLSAIDKSQFVRHVGILIRLSGLCSAFSAPNIHLRHIRSSKPQQGIVWKVTCNISAYIIITYWGILIITFKTQARNNQDLKIVSGKIKSCFVFARRGWGLGRGPCPIPNLTFFKFWYWYGAYWKPLDAESLEIVTFL